MKKGILYTGAMVMLFFTPVFVFAQNTDVSYVTTLIDEISNIIGFLLPLLMALTVLFIFYGLAKMAFAAGDEEARKEGRQYAIWGVIALVIMVGLYALVAIVKTIFGLDSTTPLRVITVPGGTVGPDLGGASDPFH